VPGIGRVSFPGRSVRYRRDTRAYTRLLGEPASFWAG
jgi:hypothetical protein